MAVTIEKMNRIRRATERAVDLYRSSTVLTKEQHRELYGSGSGSGEAIGTADAEFLNCPREFDLMCVRFYRAIGRR